MCYDAGHGDGCCHRICGGTSEGETQGGQGDTADQVLILAVCGGCSARHQEDGGAGEPLHDPHKENVLDGTERERARNSDILRLGSGRQQS